MDAALSPIPQALLQCDLARFLPETVNFSPSWIWGDAVTALTDRLWREWCCVASRYSSWGLVAFASGFLDYLLLVHFLSELSCHIVKSPRHIETPYVCRCFRWQPQLTSQLAASVDFQPSACAILDVQLSWTFRWLLSQLDPKENHPAELSQPFNLWELLIHCS